MRTRETTTMARIWWLLPGAVAVLLCALALVRYAANPIPQYGLSGAPYIEHVYRLQVAQLWQDPAGPGVAQFLAQADHVGHSYPPLMHVLYLPAGAVLGHAAPRISWLGVVWYLWTAASLGVVAWCLTRRRRVAVAATVATLLLPCLHATATRYYYDLPMTALLWSSVAVLLLTVTRRPWVGGLLVGLGWSAACLVKWTALPFGLFMFAGALLAHTGLEDEEISPIRAPRLKLAAVGLALFTALVLTFLSGSTTSLAEMSRTFVIDEAARVRVDEVGSGGMADALGIAAVWWRKVGALAADPPVAVVTFFLGRLVVAVLSPMVALFALALAARGWRHIRGLPLVAATVLGQLVFLAVTIQYSDERFLMTLAPALCLVVATAWGGLGQKERWIWAVVGMVIGAGVAVDFHTGRPDGRPGIGAAVGLQSSFAQRGWGRADEEQRYLVESRAHVDAAVEACGDTIVSTHLALEDRSACVRDLYADLRRGWLVGPGALDMVELCQDDHWWQYRANLAQVDSRVPGGARRAVWELESVGGGEPVIRARLVLCNAVNVDLRPAATAVAPAPGD